MKTHSSKKHLAFTAMLAAIVVAGHAQNVGIGTSTPTARLHVAGTLRVDDASIFNEKVGIGTGGDELNAVLTVKGKTGQTTGPETLADFRSARFINFLNSQIVVRNPDPRNAAIMGTNMEGAFVGVATATRFDIRMGNEVRMIFDAGGRVGIGTGTPTARLHVAGTLRVDDASIFNEKVGIGIGTPTARLHVGGTLRVDGASVFNEKVGIGTLNDVLTVPLTVQSMNYSTTSLQTLAEFKSLALGSPIQIRVKHADENRAAVLGTNETGAFVGVHGSSRFDIRQNNEVRMTFDPNGRVGIGIGTPTARLHVSGTLLVDGASVFNEKVGIGTDNIAGGQLDVNGSLALRSASIQVAAIQTTIAAGNRSFLRLANGMGGPAFITMEPGSTDGQVLIILADMMASNSPIVFLDNGSNRTQLNTDYQMGTDDTLTLVWSELRQRWIELSRSVN